jgi:phenylalanyl-tRNA synthetase beta chain
MKISFNLLKKFLDIEESEEKISELLTVSGLEVSSFKKSLNQNLFEKVVICKILEIKDHPNSEKLKVLEVFDGKEIFQVVCGAKNIEKNQISVFAKIGAVFFDIENNKIEIKKAKIRGVYSFGMICSEQELGIGQDGEEILDLDESFVVGESLDNYKNIFLDTIFSIEITPNRGDACSHLGVARDLSAILNRPLKQFERENIEQIIYDENILSLEILAENSCDSFHTLFIKNIENKKSPFWLRKILKDLGIKPKSFFVDISNYLMIEIGQPTHCYDFDKLENKNLRVNFSKKEEKIITLNKVEKELNEKNLLIYCKDYPACVAGIIGSEKYSIDENTKNIIIESAFFDSSTVRISSKSLDISTDASFRFERTIGNFQKEALERILFLTKKNIKSSNFIRTSFFEKKKEKKKINFFFEKLKKISGIIIDRNKVIEILKNLEFEIIYEDLEKLILLVPFFKSDVNEQIDVVEEVMRIFGYEKINSDTKINLVEQNFESKIDNLKEKIENLLVINDFFEVLTNPMISSFVVKNFFDENIIIKIKNPNSIHYDIMRPSMIFSFLEIAKRNFNNGCDSLSIFESGKIYKKIENNFIEENILSIFISEKNFKKNWYEDKKKSNFYDVLFLVEKILNKINSNIKFLKKESSDLISDYCVDYSIEDKKISRVFEIKKNILESYDTENGFFVEFFLDEILKFEKKDDFYHQVNLLPKIERDLSFFLPNNLKYSSIQEILNKNLNEKNIFWEVNLIDIFEDKNFIDKKSYTIKIIFQSKEKNLNSEFIYEIVKKIEKDIVEKLSGVLR